MSMKDKRRELRKLDKARRFAARFRVPRSEFRVGAAALAAAGAIAAGTQAYGAPVRFDNPPGPGHFVWGQSPASIIDLDIALDAALQPGDIQVTPTRFRHNVEANTNGYVVNLAGSNLQVGGFGNLFLVGVNSGQLIPSGASFANVGNSYYPGYGSELPNGSPTYLGVRFNPGDGIHFGWIGVMRSLNVLDAFAWGYETTPGVPIAAGVPEPGTLALLAIGVAGVVTKRRRRA